MINNIVSVKTLLNQQENNKFTIAICIEYVAVKMQMIK